MADEHDDRLTPERYEDTEHPRNPPNSVANRDVRRAALRAYLGPLVVLFIVLGLGLIYWANHGPVRPDPQRDEIGTSGQDTVGERGNNPDTPGGFDPQGRPGSTADELERRGVDARPQGPMPGLTSSAARPLNELGSVLEDNPREVAGRHIEVHDVNVVDVQSPTMFWVQDGNAKVAIVTADGGAAIRPGSRVNVAGTVEADGQGSARIRASRIEVR